MKRNSLLILMLALVMLATGCFSTNFTYADKTPGRTQDVGRSFLIGGLIDLNDPLRAYELCPEGVQGVETVHTFGDSFLACLTVGIYTPNTVVVTCGSGVAHNFYLDESDQVVAHQQYDQDGNLVAETFSSDVL